MLFLPATRRALPVSFARHFDALFDDAFEPFFRAGEATRAPSMDIAESDSAYTVTLDVPGTAREQLKVSIEGKRVAIEAEATPETRQENGVRAIYRERGTRRYARVFELPAEVDEATSQAKLDNGVLTLTLNKKVAAGAKQISIN
jgi:HSP20 family protein